MSEPWLDERRTWTGHWWLPGTPDESNAGFLTYDPESGLELTLVGGFEDRIIRQDGPSAFAVLEGSRTWEVLHSRPCQRLGAGGICPCCEEMITVEKLTEDTGPSQPLPVASTPVHH